MTELDNLRATLPELTRDIKINLQSVLSNSTLNPAQRWGVVVASALAARNPQLARAAIADARAEVAEPVIEDALAAAALMGMNNVYYRFRHLLAKPEYEQKPARLRMTRLAKPATNKTDFELFCLAVSAINACETCIQAHEKVVLAGGLSDEQVHDAARIAATIYSAAIALEVGALAGLASGVAAEVAASS